MDNCGYVRYLFLGMESMTDAPEPTIRFHKERFVEAVFEVIQRCTKEPQRLGKSRLHAALYYSDMSAYLDKARPITGAEYIKEPFGPAAKYLDWALDVLEKDGRVNVERTVKYGLPKLTLTVADATRGTTNVLGDEDRATIRFWADWVCGFDQTDFGDVCRLKPWNSVRRYGERIPYASAFLLLPERRPALESLQRKAG